VADPYGDLADRRAQILRALVSHYVRSGEPVGSKTLVEKFSLGVSAATVRNELAALEEAGLIQQPHTSAGRIPTDAGYRVFVDRWGERVRLPERDARQVRRFFGQAHWELEEALRQTASLLSDLTDHAAVVFAPALDHSRVRHVEIVALDGNRAMVVVVTETGRVYNHSLQSDSPLDDRTLADLSVLANTVVSGSMLNEAGSKLVQALNRFPSDQRALASVLASVLGNEIARQESERLYFEGTSNIIDEEKFSDLETVRHVIEALEHRRLFLEVLADALAAGRLSVRIGSENPLEEMQFCSVVTAPYGSEGTPIGSLGVVGPTRMDYRRTIAAVHEVAAELGRMLSGI
jgi:heat-inducible transcriptional repressor